ncbi:ABATE domain-containing protein [Leifsonia sp. ZF2019]|uniref:CGNR zinc finger domain-containing protein n=1 Tax=Leifsonia sp. ZF2019 TaxID=2781978 RepID=UPI001CC06BA1|nr:ABATE domain-containing protein [Leifsonia sp. ZF2019]UAJ78848.1 ABATE domain-containing protein [Leifsonia sp. ZF2019]
MTSRTRWIWLGDHLAVDFANTTIGLGVRRAELIGTVEEFRAWIEAEPAWLPAVDDGDIELGQVLEQRDATDRLLRCAARGMPLATEDIELINSRVRAAGVSRLLATVPGTSRLAADAGFPALLGVLGAATVDLLARDDLAAIAICEAPGCGQIFHRSRRNQRWCSPGCGNRARVDRHRHRNPVAGAVAAR